MSSSISFSNVWNIATSAIATGAYDMVAGGGLGALLSSGYKVFWKPEIEESATPPAADAPKTDPNISDVYRIKKADTVNGLFKEIYKLSSEGLKLALGSSLLYFVAKVVWINNSDNAVGQHAYALSQLILKVNKWIFNVSPIIFIVTYVVDPLFYDKERTFTDHAKITAVHAGTIIAPLLLGGAVVLIADQMFGK